MKSFNLILILLSIVFALSAQEKEAQVLTEMPDKHETLRNVEIPDSLIEHQKIYICSFGCYFHSRPSTKDFTYATQLDIAGKVHDELSETLEACMKKAVGLGIYKTIKWSYYFPQSNVVEVDFPRVYPNPECVQAVRNEADKLIVGDNRIHVKIKNP